MRLLRRTKRKRAAELEYWRARRAEAELEAGIPFYEWAFTEHFGLPASFYSGLRMLDVGCGPRGSLEWAQAAAERIGVDPLAEDYKRLHTSEHAMTYVAAGAEAMPFATGHFDVVSCFNALDHVEDVGAAIAELARVAAPGATLLLLVDVDHEPTVTEPHRLTWELPESFAPAWRVVERRDLERGSQNMLANLQAAEPFDHADARARAGVLSARLERAQSGLSPR